MSKSRDGSTATEHLEELLAGVSRVARDRGYWSSSESHRSIAFAGALEAYCAIGELSDAERAAWLARLTAVVRDLTDQTAGGAVLATTEADAAPPAGNATPGGNEFVDFEPTDVVVAPEDARIDGLRLISLELYEHHIVVRWNRRGRRGVDPHDELPDLTLGDDMGTTYESRRRRATGTVVVKGETHFVPGPPRGTREIRVHIEDRIIRIGLEGRQRWG